MKASTLIRTLLVAAVAVAGTSFPSAADAAARRAATPLLTWSDIGVRAITIGRPPSSSQVHSGILHVALHDTVVALGAGGRPVAARVRPDRSASAEAALATAARDLLVARIPTQQSAVEDAYVAYLDGVREGRAKARGIRLGKAVAADVLAWRAGDGFEATVPYVQPTPGPGVWEPTAATPPVDTVLTGVRPLTLRSRDQFRPAGPPALTSRQYARDLAEVAAVGRADSTVRTPAETENARFWSDNGAGQYNRALARLAVDGRLDLRATSRMLLLSHVSAADAVLGCWDAKYHYVAWRPVHGITRADTDGNPATVADPTWTSLLAANHPEYPSGHSCFTTALLAGLAASLGTSRVPLTVDSAVTGTTVVYPDLRSVSAAVTEARIDGGLHFRYAMTDGAALGTRAARWAVDRLRDC